MLKEHLERLKRNLIALQIPVAVCDGIPEILSELIRQSGYSEARLYIQISRGVGQRSLAIDPALRPTVVMFIESLDVQLIESLQRNGVTLMTHPDLRWARCDLKTTGLLPNVLAHQFARSRGAFDALLIDADGYIRETTQSSFFLVLHGNVLVPPADDHLLPGITRSLVLRLTERLNIPVILRKPRVEELPQAEEAFLTATSAEIVPVTRIDEQTFAYCQDSPKAGPITRKLLRSYKSFILQSSKQI